MRALLVLMIAAAAGAASAQTVVDNSGDAIPKPLLDRALRLTADQFADPDGARFRRLIVGRNGTTVCGEVNPRNQFGGYTGYRLFAHIDESLSLIGPAEDGKFKEYFVRLAKDCGSKPTPP